MYNGRVRTSHLSGRPPMLQPLRYKSEIPEFACNKLCDPLMIALVFASNLVNLLSKSCWFDQIFSKTHQSPSLHWSKFLQVWSNLACFWSNRAKCGAVKPGRKRHSVTFRQLWLLARSKNRFAGKGGVWMPANAFRRQCQCATLIQ